MGIAIPLFTAIYLNNKGKGNSWLKHATRSLIGSSTSLGYILQKFYHIHNRWQNELRRFTLKGLFDIFLTSKEENIAFPPPSAPCNVVPLFKLPLENNKHPNFEWRGQGRGVHGFLINVLWSYPIWVQCLNNFVANCSCMQVMTCTVGPPHKHYTQLDKEPHFTST